jgi:urease accessory protein
VTRARLLVPAVAVALSLPSVAHAHLVNSGLGPFYDGALHLLLSPGDVLGLLAIALLAGLRGPRAGRLTSLTLPAVWLIAGLIGLKGPVVPELAWLNVLSFAILGVLVAADARLPDWTVVLLAGLFGALHGLLNGSALVAVGADGSALLGIVLTVMSVALLVSAVVVSLAAPWMRIAVRVAGSWIAAVGMLMFGWLVRGAG